VRGFARSTEPVDEARDASLTQVPFADAHRRTARWSPRLRTRPHTLLSTQAQL
jgi:hypothetical protein